MSAQDISAMADKALVLIEKNQLPEAQQLYEQITAADPGNADAWARLCRLHTVLGHYEQAEPCCRKVVALLPDSTESLVNLANSLLQLRHYM